MLYTGNIHLANDFTYICVHCTGQYKINRDTQALQSVTADFSRIDYLVDFFRLAALDGAHLELSG